MPPTGIQRDPYGVDTEGATIPRLKPWVTPTQPPRDYPHCHLTTRRMASTARKRGYHHTEALHLLHHCRRHHLTHTRGYRTRRHRLPAQIRHSSHSEMTPDIIDCPHYGSPIGAGVT